MGLNLSGKMIMEKARMGGDKSQDVVGQIEN